MPFPVPISRALSREGMASRGLQTPSRCGRQTRGCGARGRCSRPPTPAASPAGGLRGDVTPERLPPAHPHFPRLSNQLGSPPPPPRASDSVIQGTASFPAPLSPASSRHARGPPYLTVPEPGRDAKSLSDPETSSRLVPSPLSPLHTLSRICASNFLRPTPGVLVWASTPFPPASNWLLVLQRVVWTV